MGQSKTLSEAQKKALEIIRDHGPIRPREFARKMWPDSEGWRRSSRAGLYGSSRGGGMNLAAGGYLGKLARKGWIVMLYERLTYGGHSRGYVLTPDAPIEKKGGK